MAKDTPKYPYPSVFGSHRSMLNEKATEEVGDSKVVCTDEFGDYITSENRLDNGLADPNRCDEKRLSRLF